MSFLLILIILNKLKKIIVIYYTKKKCCDELIHSISLVVTHIIDDTAIKYAMLAVFVAFRAELDIGTMVGINVLQLLPGRHHRQLLRR